MGGELWSPEPTPSTGTRSPAQPAVGETPPSTSLPNIPHALHAQVEHYDKAVKASSARDLWREALKKLPKQTQQKLNMGEAEQKPYSQQIDELLKVAKTRQEECEKNYWKFPVGNREIVLRDYAVKIISSLQQVGDIAIQFAPPQASIAWSTVKIVLQVRIITFSIEFPDSSH